MKNLQILIAIYCLSFTFCFFNPATNGNLLNPFKLFMKNYNLNLKDKIEIDEIIEKFFKSNLKGFLDLNKNETNSFKCNLCDFIVTVFKNLFTEPNGIDKLAAILTKICSMSKMDSEVCSGAIGLYKYIVINNLVGRFADGQYICNLLKLCNNLPEYEDVEQFADRILNGKNYTKRNPKEYLNSNGEYYKVIQVTDTHFDSRYLEGGLVNCNDPLCCRKTPDQSVIDYIPDKIVIAGKFGTIGKCDCNIEAIKALAVKLKELNPDYIYFTGDNVAHNVWEVKQEEIIESTRIQIEAIKEVIGNTVPIFPSLGNHEKAPVDEFFGEEKVLLYGMADIFKDTLTDQEAFETFRKYGYYTMLVPNTKNLRIISLNSLVCDSFNFYLLTNSSQPRNMFKWLENVLENAEKNNEIVHIIDHIPIQHNQRTKESAGRLKVLLDRYQNIIKGYFSGHTHNEFVTLVHEYYNPNKITQINYVASGYTTYREYNPSFRMFLIDKENYFVQDFYEYRLDVVESNNQNKAVWFNPYNATNMFKVSSLNDLEGIAKYEIGEEYVKHSYTDTPTAEEKSHQQWAIDGLKCNFYNDNIDDLFKCSGVDKFSQQYLHYILNNVFAKWLK